MYNRILSLSAAAALIVATAAAATAQNVAYSTSSPVEITLFRINESIDPATTGRDVGLAPQFIASDIAIRFVNRSNVAATTVTFLVHDGKYVQRIVDKGTFSPGVQIRHTFAVGSGTTLPNGTCNVAEVDFADGSAWHIAGADVVSR